MDKCASTKINSFYSAEHKSIIKLGPTNSKNITFGSASKKT